MPLLHTGAIVAKTAQYARMGSKMWPTSSGTAKGMRKNVRDYERILKAIALANQQKRNPTG